MADGGGINLRLSLKGAEQVRSELANLGPAGSQAMRELDRSLRTPGAGLKALDSGVGEARRGLDGLAGRAGSIGTVLGSLGPWGLAAAAGMAAVGVAASMAISQAREAATFADEIEDSAAKINIGVEALQAWRFAAEESGATAQDADAAIGGFQKKLGEAMAGGRSLKWFERLGFGKEDLDAFASTEDALMAVVGRIGDLGNAAEQAAVTEKLGLGPLAALVRQGDEAVQGLIDRARDLGIVMSKEMVGRGAEAARQMEIISQVIDLQLKQAVIDLGPAIVETLKFVAKLASGLNALADAWKGLETKSTEGLRNQDAALARRQMELIDRWGGVPNNRQARYAFDVINRQRSAIAAQLAERGGAQTEEPDGPTLIDLPAGGGAGPSAEERAAEERRREAEREIERLDRDEANARREHIRELWGHDETVKGRAELARQLQSLDQDEADAARRKRDDTITAGEMMSEEVRLRLDLIDDLRMDAEARRGGAAAAEEAKALRQIAFDAERMHADTQREIIEAAAGEVRTQGERRAIETRLLALAEDQERRALEKAILDTEELDIKAQYQARLAALPEIYAAQSRAMQRRTAGPVEAWREGQFRSAGEASEYVTGQALDALDGLNSGLIDAWKNADNAGDAFANMGRVAVDALGQVADALLKIALQRMLIQPLGDALFGSGEAGSSQGLLGSFISNFTGRIMGGASPGGAGAGIGTANAGLVDQTLKLMSAQGLPSPSAALPSSAPVAGSASLALTVVNKGEPMKASMSQGSGGQPILTLEPMRQAVKGVVREMGGNGTLMSSLAMTPQPRRR